VVSCVGRDNRLVAQPGDPPRVGVSLFEDPSQVPNQANASGFEREQTSSANAVRTWMVKTDFAAGLFVH